MPVTSSEKSLSDNISSTNKGCFGHSPTIHVYPQKCGLKFQSGLRAETSSFNLAGGISNSTFAKHAE